MWIIFTVFGILSTLKSSFALVGRGPVEVQRYDGWYNNLAHPDWGSVESHIIRKAPTSYTDGVYMLAASSSQPNPRLLSQHFMRGRDGLPSARNRTTMLAFFGEFLSFDILQGTDNSCPIEMLKIPIETCDDTFDPECQGQRAMPILRTKYDLKTGQSPNSPRAQVNVMSSWLDGSAVYSTKDIWLQHLRSWKNGTLNLDGKTGLPPLNTINAPIANPAPSRLNHFLDPSRLFLLGDARSNQHPPILAISILFYRFHNIMAEKVQHEHPDWSDEDVFQQARRWVIAIIQNIALYEYLPAFLDMATEPYKGYQPDVHPGISDVFQAAAFRFGHTQIPAGLYTRDEKCHYQKTSEGYPAYRLCNTWWDSQTIISQVGGIEPILMGLVSQIGEREDAIIIDDLREHIFGPLEFSRRDLAAVNIMRGRDYGLPDYNSARKAFKLSALSNWSDINPLLFSQDPPLLHLLRDLYRDKLGDVDLYVGGMLECDGSKPGPLFSNIIQEQFYRLRDADRFWFENQENGLFTNEEIAQIKQTTLHDVIVVTTNISPSAIQKDVFFWRQGDPCPQPTQLRGEMLEPCVALGAVNKDVFAGNEIPFIFTCVLIGFIGILAYLTAYLLSKYRGRKRRKFFKHQHDHKAAHQLLESNPLFPQTQTDKSEKVIAVEWLHDLQQRPVKIKFSTDHGKIHVENRKGDRIRTINISSVSAMLLEITEDLSEDPMALLRIHKEHDLVLIFGNGFQRNKFTTVLTQFLKVHGKELVITPTTHDQIYSTAETKEKRQKRLEKFFKIAYVRAFGLDKKERTEEELKECEEVMEMKLTKADFAEALAMKPGCAFIQKMFNCIDKKNEGRISFQQFLDLILQFARGDVRSRLRVLFDMCDVDENGLIHREQLLDLLRSLLDMTASEKGGISSGLDVITTQIFEQYGLTGKAKLSFEDFLRLFLDQSQYPQDYLYNVGLDFKGVHQNFVSSAAATDPTHRRQTISANSGNGNMDFIADSQAAASAEKEAFSSISLAQRVRQRFNNSLTYMEEHKQQIFYLVVFYVAIAGAWIERFSFYMFLNETSDLRRVMGAGIAITRGSAAAMSLAFSVLLLAVSKNIITRLRETFLHNYIPFDSAITFHKIAAWTGAFFALIHTVGHLFNFYHVSTQPIAHLQCLFKEVSFGSSPPPFTFWMYKSLTGFTGLLLVIVLCNMYMFASSWIREYAYKYFWAAHKFCYVIFYILCILHGLPRLTGEARFPLFLLVPLMVFVVDKLLGVKQTVQDLQVYESELLPSDVIHLKFERPPHFTYRSGQWIRLTSESLPSHEFHPFTLTSMPQDKHLSVHIKAHGIWTWRLRQAFDPANNFANLPLPRGRSDSIGSVLDQPQPGVNEHRFPGESGEKEQPKLRIEGPFGGGNQNWYKYEVAIMVGAGIGVTPYASILKDLVFGTSTNRYSGFACKKVYFIWICPSHKPFEWFVDALREIEKRDVTRVLEMHIFVTQFFHKFDLRTTILYVCENHFQRFSKKSLFTGLKAVNHFGRPDMPAFLRFVKQRHPNVATVGVFSCGPKQMTKSTGKSCEIINREREYPRFLHHYENF